MSIEAVTQTEAVAIANSTYNSREVELLKQFPGFISGPKLVVNANPLQLIIQTTTQNKALVYRLNGIVYTISQNTPNIVLSLSTLETEFRKCIIQGNANGLLSIKSSTQEDSFLGKFPTPDEGYVELYNFDIQEGEVNVGAYITIYDKKTIIFKKGIELVSVTNAVPSGVVSTFVNADEENNYWYFGYAPALYRDLGPLLNSDMGDSGDPTIEPFDFEWNAEGWGDFSDLEAKTYVNLSTALGGDVANQIVGKELIMRVWDYDGVRLYFKVKFTQYSPDGTGGGFALEYDPFEFVTTESNLESDADITTTKYVTAAGFKAGPNSSYPLNGFYAFLANGSFVDIRNFANKTTANSFDSGNQYLNILMTSGLYIDNRRAAGVNPTIGLCRISPYQTANIHRIYNTSTIPGYAFKDDSYWDSFSGEFWFRLVGLTLGVRALLGTTVDNGVDKLQIEGSVALTSSIAVGNNATAATISNVGAIRYRTSGNNSYMEMCMQTGASTYAWVVVKQNTW